MKIGIIGTGNVGSALGRGWARKGHEVRFGSRDPGRQPGKAAASGLQLGTISEAVAFGPVLVLAAPFNVMSDLLSAAGDLSGKVLVDCTNPLLADLSGLALGHSTSAAEEIAGMAPGARVVKCFNSTGSANMANPMYGNEALSMCLCGDDAEAKGLVAQLASDLGFDPVDAGPLTSARLLEPLAMLWIELAYRQGLGSNIGFKLLRR